MEEQVELTSKMHDETLLKQQETRDKLQRIINDTTSLEAKAKIFENIMKQEEIRNKQLEKDLKSSRELRKTILTLN